jgi:sulfoxide reductase heme-binding subunit YedZ
MSVGYVSVTWSRHKIVYDLIAVAGVVVYLAVFALASVLLHAEPGAISPEVVLIRATGSCALVLLHVVLSIGPLCRLEPRLLAVLFNRRHLGVLTFLVALVHGVVTIGYYHGFGAVSPLYSLLTSNTNYTSLSAFPFETLGLIALLILFLLAATSHDFWLKNLSARWWKTLHMLVYVAYALLLLHVALGALQDRVGPMGLWLVVLGAVWVGGLHVVAGVREWRADRRVAPETEAGWLDAGAHAEIPRDRARVIATPQGERIAVFSHADGISAVTNVCAHQGGPLGEGAVIDGCITCPWHGWQYRPGDGCSPPPFVERVATYPVRIVAGRVLVRSTPVELGVATPPARTQEGTA